MPRRATLRASDRDREQVADRLRQAAAEGRLLAEELEHRLARALRARTYGELDPLVADLPDAQAGVVRRRGLAPVPVIAASVVIVAVLVVALALAAVVLTGLFAGWAVWLLVAWWFMGRGRRAGRRHARYYAYGPRGHVRMAHRRTLL
ncbi:MAG TPA: DUF1707 domain-containing protein [Solirubrobacteraceae bacterium]|nr:DUF1707 domain-containing protein [Solirubrobacteraceae bacterium]